MNIFQTLRNKEKGLYVNFKIRTVDDDNQEAPDKNCDGYWPSLNPNDAGYIGENPKKSFDQQMEEARQRLRDWELGRWNYIGVYAVAQIHDHCGGCITTYTLESSGLWGIESDNDDYIQEVFKEQCDELRDVLGRMNPVNYI